MNTLVLLLLTASVPAQPGPVIQNGPTPLIQNGPGPVTSTYDMGDTGDTGWFGRFRNGQGMFPRLRNFFNRGRTPSALQDMPPAYPGNVTSPGIGPDARLVPTPVLNAPISTAPTITYGTGPAPTISSVPAPGAQPLPTGNR